MAEILFNKISLSSPSQEVQEMENTIVAFHPTTAPKAFNKYTLMPWFVASLFIAQPPSSQSDRVTRDISDLQNAKDAYKRVRAARILGLSKAIKQLTHEQETHVHEALILALEDSDKTVRVEAAIALAFFYNEKAIPVLLQALETPDYRNDSVSDAFFQLGEMVVDALVEQLKKGNEPKHRAPTDRQIFLIQTLGKLKNSKAVNTLISCLKIPALAKEAAIALFAMGDERAFETSPSASDILLSSIGTGEFEDRVSTVELLVERDDKRILWPAVQLLEELHRLKEYTRPDDDSAPRLEHLLSKVTQCLIKLGDPRAAKALHNTGRGRDTVEALYETAITKVKTSGDLRKAIRYQKMLLAMDRDWKEDFFSEPFSNEEKARIHFDIARLYQQLNEIDQAIANCKKSIALCDTCDDYSAKKLFIELTQPQPNKSKSIPLAYLGFVSLKNTPVLNRDMRIMLETTLFQALKARQVDVQIPNVDGYMDRQEISLCSEEACVSEVTGMMGLEAGLYIGIEENSTSLIFTVNVVDLEGRISNRVAISRTREKLRSIQDSENVANALADVFLQQNH
ncbi:MAG: hypothetical protein A3I05_04250 [Deltaproteobacteria bacterium RIFCSPLOWO2_02_FULL_44_10]|nr:MAG: hypothetical protein A3C46_07065 [Deltaproteobacteria bacterium RIFCSPHIGHO2_02_FULL_44_16]OGQ46578.1 MAG: hypothetical protein A3I05_04250 [Deltaproteobacteria bacterium RIFCSPLOWO2_02_FULL_44_10]